MSGSAQILIGDCVEEMAKMPADSVDAIVTDPPYGLEFMGKEWDRLGGRPVDTRLLVEPEAAMGFQDGAGGNAFSRSRVRNGQGSDPKAQQAWHEPWAREAFRVLKPGGFAVVAGGTRTFHRLVCALEDAGFEIRDTIAHIYGSGFPKSKSMKDIGHPELGTALKPAFEPWTLARKPLSEKNVAQNVLRHGTGAINVDATRVGLTNYDKEEYIPNRVGYKDGIDHQHPGFENMGYSGAKETGGVPMWKPAGRWPPNLLLSHHPDCKPTGEVRRVKGYKQGTMGGYAENGSSYKMGRRERDAGYADPDGTEPQEVWECVAGCPVAEMDRQSGERHSSHGGGNRRNGDGAFGLGHDGGYSQQYYDKGGASRFFPRFEPEAPPEAPFRYVAKASRRERNVGLEGMPENPRHTLNDYVKPSEGRTAPKATGGPQSNNHPTVKPIALMRWLVRLVTPPGGTVLDPFAGSGSTGCVAVLEGFDFIGIEQDEEYAEIARRRIAYWSTPEYLRPKTRDAEVTEAPDPTDPTFSGRLF